MRIAALGRTKILWNSIKKLSSEGHELALMATCRAAPEYDVNDEDFKQLAAELGATFLMTQSLNRPEVVEKVRNAGADIAVSVNWINIIGPELCGAFRHGILNAHAGDLPRYRGNAPVAWAILQGESKIGLTVHRMDPYALDSGPVFVKDYFPLTDSTYIAEVFRWIESRVPDLFLGTLNAIEDGTLQPTSQPEEGKLALRCYPRRPEDASIRWHMPAEYLARLVRASSEPFGGAYSYYKGSRITIWRAHAEPWSYASLAIPGQVTHCNLDTGEVKVATSEGQLVLEEVRMSKQSRSKPTWVIKSLRDRLTDERGLDVATIRQPR